MTTVARPPTAAPTAPRTIAVWCPDWPVTAALADTDDAAVAGDAEAPAAVVVANRVVASSHAARAAGVLRGLRRREAQARCPELIVLARNEAAEARLFEPVVVALESVAPGVEITRPGLAAIGARGPTRYFGGEAGVLQALSRELAGVEILAGTLIGVADGAFAAEQAARRGMIVEPGGAAGFLAPMPIETLDLAGTSGLVDLLRRLGVLTLGQFAALPARDVLARFGPAGLRAHQQASGLDDRPVSGRRVAVEFSVTVDFEPALDRVDTIAFSARASADRFVDGLAAHGLACSCLELQAFSENGEQTVRRWRHAGVLGSGEVIDRVRWQLEGWLSGPHGPSAGVIRLRLVPVETVPTGTHQQALWGGSSAADERAGRALARVQTLLGHGSVLSPVVDGGRDPLERTRLVPWGDEPVPQRPPEQPWPGQLPAPLPTVLFDPPRPAQVLDDHGVPVIVTERGAMPRPPARLVLGDQAPVAITAWAGPWPLDERWWSTSARRVVRCQLVDVRGGAYLASGTMTDDGPRWQIDARYD